MNTTLIQTSSSKIVEQRIVLQGISWQQYEILRTTLDEIPGAKMIYLDEILEIMTPSPEHEATKATIGELLSTYLKEKNIRFYRCGSPTLKNQMAKRGKEPDESYNIGTKKEIPEIAIEVVVSSGGLNILSVYQGLGIPEVWVWKQEKLTVYRWRDRTYEQIAKSEFLPELDLDLLVRYINYSDQYDAVVEFREAIRR
jgi:Uma2 family endonuclease